MGFRKATLVASLLTVCLVLAAQSVKADNIVFNDLTDTATLTATGTATTRLINVLCPLNGDICTATINAPSGYAALVGSITYFLGETTLTGNISDDFVATIGSVAALLKFDSDLPGTPGETTNLGPCPVPMGCNAVENGLPQLVGTITWINLTNPTLLLTDNFFIQSDLETASVVPEPGSLALLGSGLVMAAAFLRRRRRPEMPSPV